jgi:hypothetical protein
MVDIIVQFVVLLGLASVLPRPSSDANAWLGARVALAGYCVVILLFLGSVLGGIALSTLTWMLTAIGCLAALFAVIRWLRSGKSIAEATRALAHPVCVFSIVFVLVSGARGGISYQPYLGDELASWLNLTRQIFLADRYWSPEMDYSLPSYSNGWPLLLAAASSIYSSFAEAHAVPTIFFLHLGLIGFTFDYLLYRAAQDAAGNALAAYLLAWLGCLLLLAAEVTFLLLPTDLLSEHPVTYTYAICFLIAILGMETRASPTRLAFYLGIVVAAGYLFKVSILAAAPALALIVLAAVWRSLREDGASDWRDLIILRAVRLLAITFVPVACLVIIWHFASTGDQLSASFGNVEHGDWGLLVSARGGALLTRMADALLTYGTAFKLPLTLVAITVALVALATRYAVVTLAFAVYFAATVAGLYVYYIYRTLGIETGYLESYQRFMMVPIRILHYIGLVLLVAFAIRAAGRSHAFLRPSAVPALALVAVIGMGWQVHALDRSLVDVAERPYQDQTNVRAVITFKTRIAQLIEEIGRRGLERPTVGVIDSQGYDVAWSVASYYSLKTERGGHYRYFVPERAGAPAASSAYDVLWPVSFNENEHKVLRTLIDACGYDVPPEHVFLFKAGASYDCVPFRS